MVCHDKNFWQTVALQIVAAAAVGQHSVFVVSGQIVHSHRSQRTMLAPSPGERTIASRSHPDSMLVQSWRLYFPFFRSPSLPTLKSTSTLYLLAITNVFPIRSLQIPCA